MSLVLALFVGSATGLVAQEGAAGGATGTDTNNSVYAKLPKDRFGAVVYTITRKDMMLDNWVVELNSSANTIVNRRNSYTKRVRNFSNKKSYLGIRVKFPTHGHNAFARVAPAYRLPAFDARGYPVNYGFFDPDAQGANPYEAGPFANAPSGPSGSAAEVSAGDPAYTTYSAVSRVPGIKTFIDFNDYDRMIANVKGYINVRYLGDLANKAASVGYDEGMPVIGFPLDPDGDVDSKKLMQLTQVGNLFAEADATRHHDAYAAAIRRATEGEGAAAPSEPTPGSQAAPGQVPTHKAVADALQKIEQVVPEGGNSPAPPMSRFISYNGVIHNVSALKEIVVRVAGRNFRNGLAIRLRNQNEEVSEYFLGYLDFVGWQYRRWQNPNYLPAEEAELFRLPLYPTEIPYIAFDSFVLYRNGTQIGGDFVTYVDWVKVDYDLAIPPAQLEIDNADFVDIDDDGYWKILRERNSKKTRHLMKKFSAEIDLRRQQLGRSVRQAEGAAPVETGAFQPRNEYEKAGAAGGAAPAAGGGNN